MATFNWKGGEAIKRSLTGTYQIRCFLGTLFALVVADGLITRFLVTHGVGQEGNPFLQPLVAEGNFLFVKVAGALLSILFLWDIYRKSPRLSLMVSLGFVILYTGIVYWNLAVLFIVM